MALISTLNSGRVVPIATAVAPKIVCGISIIELIEHCVNKHNVKKDLSLEELLEVDTWARNEVVECLNQKVY